MHSPYVRTEGLPQSSKSQLHIGVGGIFAVSRSDKVNMGMCEKTDLSSQKCTSCDLMLFLGHNPTTLTAPNSTYLIGSTRVFNFFPPKGVTVVPYHKHGPLGSTFNYIFIEQCRSRN